MKISENKKTKIESEMTLEERIAEWKKEHKKVFMCTVNGKDYIWRRIKRNEYAQIMAIKEGEDVDERIYNRQYAITKLAVLNIEEAELENDLEELAGLATTIADEVLDRSGFNATPSVEL